MQDNIIQGKSSYRTFSFKDKSSTQIYKLETSWLLVSQGVFSHQSEMQAHFGRNFYDSSTASVSKGDFFLLLGKFLFRFHFPFEPILSGHMVLKTDTMA